MYKQSTELLSSLEQFCKVQLTLLTQQVTQVRRDLKDEVKLEDTAVNTLQTSIT
jgi:hypothetical protein